MGIFKNFFSHTEVNARVLTLQGIYFKSDKIYGNSAWDQLRDENTPESMTIVVPVSLRADLQNGNLVSVQGTLDRRVQNNGAIQFILNVSRVDKVKDIAISEDEIKRAECRRRKGELGYKNVDGILENKLFINQRPKVALIYADASITNADFEKGLQAAKSNIDFNENRVSFANPKALCGLLRLLDTQGYDVIAIVRGGGSGIEKLDDPIVVETLTNLQTAWIYGVGHEKENLFIRNIADKVIPIPFALGTYFRDLVEGVIQKRNNSRAVLVQEVRKQYEKQIEDSNKKNQALTKQLEEQQKQIAALTKAQQESHRQSKEQTDALKKANEEAGKQNRQLQEQLKTQGKTLSDLQEQQRKQQCEFSRSLSQMQETNKSLQTNITKMTGELMSARQRVSELENQKSNTTGYVIAIVILIILAIIGFIC